MKKLLAAALMVLLAAPAAAQVSPVPYTFTANTVIRSSEVNANFTEIFSKALNRTGGTMTGSLTTQAILPAAHNTYDFGSTGLRWKDGWFAGTLTTANITVTAAATFNSTLAIGDTGASALDVAGGIQAGSGNVGIVGTDGRIPAISSTYFASLSGANLTGIPETAITDGSLLARVASSETISGSWVFSPLSPIVGNTVYWKGHNTAASPVSLAGLDASNAALFGPSDSEVGAGCCIGTTLRGNGISFVTNNGGTPVTRTTIDATAGTLTHAYALRLTNGIDGGSLVNGNNDDLNPAGLANAATVVFVSAGGSTVLTGLAAQADGFRIRICTDGLIGIAHDNAGSADANRFWMASGTTNLVNGCTEAEYDTSADGGVGKWRLTAW